MAQRFVIFFFFRTMGIPSSAIYMLGYEHLSTVISPYFLDSSEPVYTTTPPASTSSISGPESFDDQVDTVVFESLSTLSSASATSTATTATTTKTLTASLTPAPLIAGSLARTLSATVISPIEMFRTRLQALPIRTSSFHVDIFSKAKILFKKQLEDLPLLTHPSPKTCTASSNPKAPSSSIAASAPPSGETSLSPAYTGPHSNS